MVFVDDFAVALPHTLRDVARRAFALPHTLDDPHPLVPPSHPVTRIPPGTVATDPKDAATDPVLVAPFEHTADIASHTRRSKPTAIPDGDEYTVSRAGWRPPPVSLYNEIPTKMDPVSVNPRGWDPHEVL